MMLKRPVRRALASLLATCMLLTLLPVSAFAEGGAENPEPVTVTAFDPLEETVAAQTVPCGTAREALDLPDTLRATVYATSPDAAPAVIEGVTWEPDRAYEGAAGVYAFTASAERYICAEGVDWPVITVTVEEEPAPEPDEVDALCAAIDALPTVEELYENAPGDTDPEFDDWATEMKARLAEVPALWEQLTALTGDAAALERITEARADKLAALNDLAERLPEKGTLEAHTHCVCGGSVTTGGHTHDSTTTWTAWESADSLPGTAGSYYLTQNVTLEESWTAPAGTVNLCLNGKTMTGSGAKNVDTNLYACVDIPSGAALTVCDCGSNGSMDLTPGNVNYGSAGIYGGTGSSFALYGGSISASKSTKYVVYALCNSGGTFAVHGGTVSATHASTGAKMAPFAYGVYTKAGTTTLWGGSFEAKVTNTTSYTDGNSSAYGAEVEGTGILRLAGAPTFSTSNSANDSGQAAIYTSDGPIYARAENTSYHGGSVSIRVYSSTARDGGMVVREVDSNNKGKFSVTNTTSLTLTEITEGGSTHLALMGPYKVAFNANGSTGSMTSQNFSGYTDSQTLTANTLTRKDYRFTGWNTAKNGSGTHYADKATVSKLAYGGTVTLYAQWESLPPAWPAGGEGTEQSPYVIETYEQLAAFAANVSGTGEYAGAAKDFSGKYIKLADTFPTDSGPLTAAIGGTYDTPFKGSFDGNGKAVELNINESDGDYQGLFGYVSTGGVVENVTVTGAVSGSYNVGGIAGNVTKGTVQNCVNGAAVSGTNNVGGVVGYLDDNSTMQNCYNTAAVTGTGSNVGGVAGAIGGAAVQNCYNTGAVAGVNLVGGVAGVVEFNSSTLQNCLSLGLTVTATTTGATDIYVGRVAGLAANGGILTSNKARADMEVYKNTTEAVTPTSAADGIDGADVAVNNTVAFSDVFSSASGWDTNIWTIPTGNLVPGCDLPTLTGVTQDPAPTLPGEAPHTPAAPAATAAVIDYRNETISFDSTYEMNTSQGFDGTVISTGGGLAGYISDYGTAAQTLYIRVKAAANTPASAATAVTIPARPQTPISIDYLVDNSQLTLTVNADAGVEYTLDNWNTTFTGSHTYEGLTHATNYAILHRTAATVASFKSSPWLTPIRTWAKIEAPTGGAPDKGTVTADKTVAAVDQPVTYTVTFQDGYTPTLTLTDNNNTLSEPDKGENNTWTYTYTVHKNDKTVGAAVIFAERKVESVSYSGDPITLFADSEHNATADALGAYLGENVPVTPVYDNGTTGEAVTASYALKSGSTWNAKGGTYTYTATVSSKTCEVTVTVKPVNAAIGAVSAITKAKTDAGYATHAALGLPTNATVTYTGDGYATRTGNLPFSWSEIPQDFGKTAVSHDFTGTVALPAWATYTANTVTATVTITNKTPLTQEQMSLTMGGWTYGEPASTPHGAVTIDGHVVQDHITYQYSADSGASWADTLPASGANTAKAGAYQVRMNYEGDAYTGSKTVSFTIAQKPVTLGVGALTASKVYDGDTTATLTGVPVVNGKLEGDTVTAEGGVGTYQSADVGTNITVTVTGCSLTGADAGNYSTTGTVSGLTGTITQADGTKAPGYDAALDALQKVHIVTNVTPTLADVTLPAGWAFTGITTERLTASDTNEGKQPFPVRYTPANTNYAPVTLTGDNALFPVSTVALQVDGGLDMRTIANIDGTLTLSPVALKVTGAALPASGDYAISNMEWSSSVERIATVTGSVAASGMSATITAKAKGVTMVGVAYRNGGGMLGYVLVKVMDNRTDSANTVEDITNITDTLDKLIDPQSPSETDKKAVDAVADEVTKLPDEAKKALTVDDVKALDDLKQAVGKNVQTGDNLNITIEKDAEDQAPAPSNVEVVGAAIACGVDKGNVVVTVKPVQPTGSETKLELKMELTVNGTKEELAAPMFFQMDVPDGIDLDHLKLYHVKDDGTKTELSYERTPNSRTISFKMLSFSSVQFVVPAGGTSGGTTGGGGGGTTAYTLTATAGEGGKISPSGKVRVSRNSDKTFTVTPNDGYVIADVLVDGKSVGAVGSYTFEKITREHTIAASFQAEDQCPAWNPFTDVKEGAWYYDSVKYVYEHGLMNGTSKTTFSPDLSTTRGMIVTILWRLEKEPESGADMAFGDVKAGSYYFDAIRWAVEHEIVKGFTATTFGPDNTITRQELAAILYRYAQYKGMDVSASDDLTAFTDRPDAWAENAVKWAVGAGVISGKGGGILDPKGQATRAQVAAMLMRFISLAAN